MLEPKHSRKGKPRPRHHARRIAAVMDEIGQVFAANFYEQVRGIEQDFYAALEAEDSYYIVWHFKEMESLRDQIGQALQEQQLDERQRGAVVPAFNRVAQSLETMNEHIIWPEGMEDGEICQESE